MSYIPCSSANASTENSDTTIKCDPVSRIIIPRTGDIGGFKVHRALPFRDQRMVGPFIFWDQMGPGEFLTNQGVDVRPHPHIGLSTVTYLFDGSLDHKDSLGNDIRIHPGDINLMRSGSGIVHSERTGKDIRQNPSNLFGIQSWLALPKSLETTNPTFENTQKKSLPTFSDQGISGTVIMGSFETDTSPVHQDWETLYLDVQLEPNQQFKVPKHIEERALFAVKGSFSLNGDDFKSQQMIVLKPGHEAIVTATSPLHLMVLGGAAMDGPRFIDWNFVASDKEMIQDAKDRWQNQDFPNVPGDDKERIPLPK